MSDYFFLDFIDILRILLLKYSTMDYALSYV